MTKKRRRRHTPEQIVSKLRDADAMLNAGKELAVVLEPPPFPEPSLVEKSVVTTITIHTGRNQERWDVSASMMNREFRSILSMLRWFSHIAAGSAPSGRLAYGG
jgi:hypothetical protein